MALEAQLITFVRDFIIFFAIYLVVALSLNLEYGYAGVPNFGKVLAVAGGAFTVGFFPGRLIVWLFQIAPGLDYIDGNMLIVTRVNRVLAQDPALSLVLFFGTLAIAGIIGAVLGFVSSYPAVRLREDYLAITLLAMGEAIQVIGYNFPPIAGGNLGVMAPDPFRWAGDDRYAMIAVFILGVSLLVLLYLERLVRTPLGRMLRAIRDKEDVADSLGKDVTRIRMKTIIIASMIGSIGGALDAFKTSSVISTAYHRATWTYWPWLIVILGGAANNMGVVLGTLTFTALMRFISYYKGQLSPYVPFDVVWLDLLLLGIMLILIQMFKPEGMIREKPTPTLTQAKLEKYVNSKKATSSVKKSE